VAEKLKKGTGGKLIKGPTGKLARCPGAYVTDCCNCFTTNTPRQISITFRGITACAGKRGDYLNGKRFILDLDLTSCDYGGDYWCHYEYLDSDVAIWLGFEGTVSPNVLVRASVYETTPEAYAGYQEAFLSDGYLPGCGPLICYQDAPGYANPCYLWISGTGGYASWQPHVIQEWADGILYPVGQIVTNDGQMYSCHTEHTSSASTEPGVGVSWESYWVVSSCP